MFFIMRADIIPRYEDNLNINGGCLSFKISLEDFENKFFEFKNINNIQIFNTYNRAIFKNKKGPEKSPLLDL